MIDRFEVELKEPGPDHIQQFTFCNLHGINSESVQTNFGKHDIISRASIVTSHVGSSTRSFLFTATLNWSLHFRNHFYHDGRFFLSMYFRGSCTTCACPHPKQETSASSQHVLPNYIDWERQINEIFLSHDVKTSSNNVSTYMMTKSVFTVPKQDTSHRRLWIVVGLRLFGTCVIISSNEISRSLTPSSPRLACWWCFQIFDI